MIEFTFILMFNRLINVVLCVLGWSDDVSVDDLIDLYRIQMQLRNVLLPSFFFPFFSFFFFVFFFFFFSSSSSFTSSFVSSSSSSSFSSSSSSSSLLTDACTASHDGRLFDKQLFPFKGPATVTTLPVST